MALIHIEPLPRQCSPGVVLAFVCNGTGLDRKHVGKIAFVGRAATVEIADAKAAAAVAALDGSRVQDRPVRVRFAGKADFTDADHFARLSKLLDIEAAAEQEEARRRAQAEEGSPVGDGTTLTRLVLRDAEFGLGGRLLLTFARKAGDRLPPTRLQPGSQVVLSQTNVNRRVPSYRGVVFDRDAVTIGVAIDPPDDEIPDEAVWRLDLSPDEVSRLRQQDALQRAAAANGDRLAELRAVLLGERQPEFVVPDATEGSRAPFASELNPPQVEAIALALAAKDVAIIHGPPGTGKTTTLVELIRQAVARGDTVLACAPSNHAVDNLLEKLLAAGELPVRLGHPARVAPELRSRAIDILSEKHPDARQARKVAKEAFALFRQADKWTRDRPQPGEKAALRREARQLLGESRRLEALAIERVLDETRIVCATLTGLDSQLLGKRRFALCVIDEACQSTEPACWLPLLRADRVVLAGDHCQLPPTVLSPQAAEDGLAVSLMERLVGLFGPDASRLLTIQHRMHAAIMGFSNAEFYDNALVAHESVAGHTLAGLDGVRAEPLTESPAEFLDTAGASYDEELEEDTGSRRNVQEASLAARQVRKLLAAGVRAAQIGLITPYRAQVRHLRDLLADVEGLEIDSVDGFQGREKEAIVVSLVRSNAEGEIGFLSDTRRTNVALTRARRKLVVIGDSATLSNHPFYQRMLAYFEGLGAYRSVWELTEE
ncbi:dna-binding protein smubp-2 : DNA-binding protein OS=Blastopirellula marina DSM 3645 GN=DSM3645_25482 PE=4 SV=1: DbpA: AAA_11: AAA_12 [Gemmataceae bacterium]|nr:dna-binding protein smubp-2 : DNA-binding protein OS=Blastopirellula marina DSM 3645 GN=DSM3645_25482 PE=4 SV=1: DbpA: AAA_11: AAA_12 [Gemmataceae bacterium]VTT99335.1 dna-binding protein smubp-2 : DNA-binding protein OS=Blastopirellula marina DSM 3645 GN=DSM3645_25482 PE=4 SV=1: DbpA: AAA_11: AAA_12 [Gemmataceae bacterium]